MSNVLLTNYAHKCQFHIYCLKPMFFKTIIEFKEMVEGLLRLSNQVHTKQTKINFSLSHELIRSYSTLTKNGQKTITFV